jgi:galactokinase
MTRGGFGGSAIALVLTERTAEVSSAVVDAVGDMGFGAPKCLVVTASESVRRES